MATFTKEVLKAGNGPVPGQGQSVTVEANLYLAADMTAIWCAPTRALEIATQRKKARRGSPPLALPRCAAGHTS